MALSRRAEGDAAGAPWMRPSARPYSATFPSLARLFRSKGSSLAIARGFVASVARRLSDVAGSRVVPE